MFKETVLKMHENLMGIENVVCKCMNSGLNMIFL